MVSIQFSFCGYRLHFPVFGIGGGFLEVAARPRQRRRRPSSVPLCRHKRQRMKRHQIRSGGSKFEIFVKSLSFWHNLFSLFSRTGLALVVGLGVAPFWSAAEGPKILHRRCIHRTLKTSDEIVKILIFQSNLGVATECFSHLGSFHGVFFPRVGLRVEDVPLKTMTHQRRVLPRFHFEN